MGVLGERYQSRDHEVVEQIILVQTIRPMPMNQHRYDSHSIIPCFSNTEQKIEGQHYKSVQFNNKRFTLEISLTSS